MSMPITKQPSTVILTGWIARNGDSKLKLHFDKPTRSKESMLSDEELTSQIWPNGRHKKREMFPRKWYSIGKEIALSRLPIPAGTFDFIIWESEARPVTLKIEF